MATEADQSIDVSWLHHSHRLETSTSKDATKPAESTASTIPTSNGVRDGPAHVAATNESPQHLQANASHRASDEAPPASQSATALSPSKENKSKGAPELKRRGSWITNISSKFSSSNQHSSPASPALTGGPAADPKEGQAQPLAVSSPVQKDQKKAEPLAIVPSSPKSGGPSFLQSALRRLSSSTGTGGGKSSGSGGVCPRRVMNVDPYRERCQIEDLHPGKLRRVSFSVDIEIAGPPRYDTPEEDVPPTPSNTTHPRKGNTAALEKTAESKRSQDASMKTKDKAEGAALKHPDELAEVKEELENPQEVDSAVASVVPNSGTTKNENGEKPPTTKKKEKKKRSEEERKERKERKRQAAVANGTIPIEISLDHSDSSESSSPGHSTPKSQDKPTTDPLRIYRRCCQLRESPVLKRVADQLSAVTNDPNTDGIVPSIDLTGLKIPLADTITLGDYLAVVPVRKVILEDCDLTDEAVRVVLAGLLSVKTPDQARFNRRLSKQSKDSDRGIERLGVVEKLSLKDNPRITREGWRHISFFMNMSRSLKALDVSGIKFPTQQEPVQNQAHQLIHKAQNEPKVMTSVGEIFEKCLAERLATSRLEELVMAKCNLETAAIEGIVRGGTACGIKRLGLAYNNLDEDGIQAVCNFLLAGRCEGLDLGGNRLTDHTDLLASSLKDSHHPLFALSLADCDLNPVSLKPLLPALVKLSNFRFIDLSHNRDLFSTQPNATYLLRKYLPQMNILKRIHLNDVALDSEQCIALAEVLPEVPFLSHVGFLDNPKLASLASAQDEATQEEACAYYASLMVATRVSSSIVSWDIEMPTRDTSELVQALGKQILAYALRNMERGPSGELLGALDNKSDPVPAPDILLHLLGHVDGFPENHDNDSPAPNADYIVSGTAVVKALGICLGNKATDGRRVSRPLSRDGTVSDKASGTSTPRPTEKEVDHYKAKHMSKNLLESARKIKMRLKLALAKEAYADDDTTYKRLQFLDSTLTRMIERFEEEYPDTKPQPASEPPEQQKSEPGSMDSSQIFTNPFQSGQDNDEAMDMQDDERPIHAPRHLSRHGSDVSLASKHLAHEEGQMHRFGQQMRRSLLAPSTFDYHHQSDPAGEPDHLKMLRAKLESMSGNELKEIVSKGGVDQAISRMDVNAKEILELEKQDPEGFRNLIESQRNAAANIEVRDSHSEAVQG